jgi:hypothetical protein
MAIEYPGLQCPIPCSKPEREEQGERARGNATIRECNEARRDGEQEENDVPRSGA